MKYKVTAKVDVTIAMEVSARSAKEALGIANNDCCELTPLFDGVDADLERPKMISVEDGAWFEDFETCEFFLSGSAAVVKCSTCDGDGKIMSATKNRKRPLKAIVCPACGGSKKHANNETKRT